ncbi:hematopoietic prostaglandin D synthase-like [Halichondria panicea]|uniref:hematopoietic prostaglandin D synthase-like n=1 Tax=Halichondria panicea TaxID=6063 RepID=UPI00312B77F0
MSSSPEYKLIYFHARGRAELIRFLFEHLEIQYEDQRMTFEEWPSIKPDTPFGILPILEVHGKQLTSSIGIARMIAEENGLSGSNLLENTEVFGIVSAAEDAWCNIYTARYKQKDKDSTDLKVKELHEDYLPEHIERFEKRAAANGAGWIWGDKMTYADFATYLLFQYVCENTEGAKDKYPKLAKIHAIVESLPKIAKWMKSRPETFA